MREEEAQNLEKNVAKPPLPTTPTAHKAPRAVGKTVISLNRWSPTSTAKLSQKNEKKCHGGQKTPLNSPL